MHRAAKAHVSRGGSGTDAWELATRLPAEPLRGYIRELNGYAERTPGPLRRWEFPGPQVVVILEIGPPIRVFDAGQDVTSCAYAGGFVAGLDDKASLTEHRGYQAGIQLNMTPIGARLVFGLPMSELARRVVDFRDLVPKSYAHVTERLAELTDWDARFDLVEQLLADRIGSPRPHAAEVAWSLRVIEASGGAVDVRHIADELGYSQKHLITLFRDQVGLPPKLLAQLVRFDRLMRHIKRGGQEPWAELAAAFGYADQPHLARQVKRFTGLTPEALRREVGGTPAFAADGAG